MKKQKKSKNSVSKKQQPLPKPKNPSFKNQPIQKSLNLLHSLIWILAFLLGLLYLLLTPVGAPPDELGHLSYFEHLNQTGEIPTLGSPLYNFKTSPPTPYSLNWIAQHPPLYYLAFFPFYNLFLTHFDHQTTFLLLRFLNLLLGLTTIFFIQKSVKLALSRFTENFQHPLTQNTLSIIRFSTVALLFLPQFLHLTTSINNDNLLNFLSSLIFLTIIDKTQKTILPPPFLLAILIGLSLLTKFTALPLLAIPFLFSTFIEPKNKPPKNIFLSLTKPLLTTIFILFIAFPWYFQNYLTFGVIQPELKNLSTQTLIKFPELANSFPEIKPLIYNSPNPIFTLQNFNESNYLQSIFQNFIGVFGNLSTPTPLYFTLLYLPFLLLLISTFFQNFYTQNRSNKKQKNSLTYTTDYSKFYTPSIIFILIFFFALTFKVFQLSSLRGFLSATQGRYLFPLLPIFTILITTSLHKFSDFKNLHKLLNIYSLTLIIASFTILIFTALPATLHPLYA